MKKLLLALCCASACVLPVRAEEATPAPASPLTLILTAGYDSRYVLYGYRLNRHLLGADVYAAYAMDEKNTLWGGSWFGIIPDGTYRELDAYVGWDRALGAGFTAGLAVSAFHYIEAPFTDESMVYELVGHVSYANGPFALALRDHVDTESDGHLARLIGSYTLPVTERISLKASAEYGYAFGYYIDGDKANHALFTLEAPTTLSDSVYVTPFISRTIALDAIDAFEEDDTFYGASISWML